MPFCQCGREITQTRGKKVFCEKCAKERRKEHYRKWYQAKGREYHREYHRDPASATTYREGAVPGWATCPVCGKRWWSPDHTYIKYHPACRELVQDNVDDDAYGSLRLSLALLQGVYS